VEEKQFNACMERMKSGDKDALHEIYEAYCGYIYSIVLSTVSNREDAEDVTSEFFMKLWRLADTYRGGMDTEHGWRRLSAIWQLTL
jgi:RNA polymerase sigma-70 factor (ECF subfamily)